MLLGLWRPPGRWNPGFSAGKLWPGPFHLGGACTAAKRSSVPSTALHAREDGGQKRPAFRWRSRDGWLRVLQLIQDRFGEQYDASRMDWAWWKANIKSAYSKVDVDCRECGYRSRGTMLASMQAGGAPGCFCNGAVPWSSKEGHARCLALLKDRFGEQYDAGRMDLAWWKANIKSAYSKVDVDCRECGYRSRGTMLASMQAGGAPGCFCNGAVPWSSKEGHARCLALLKDRFGEQYDASRMDWAWWKANIKSAYSKVDVDCRECGYRSRGTALGKLQAGQSPGCFCNGAVPWSSQEGHARCLALLKDRFGEQYDASRMDWAWWKANIKSAHSKVDVDCRECGYRSRGTMLANLQVVQGPGCFCNGAVPWSSKEGHARCLALLKDRFGEQYDAGRMDLAWWKANIKSAYSKVDVDCRECGYRSRGTKLANLQFGGAPGCFCNGAVPWSSQEGHARCLALLKDRFGEQYDASRMDWAWWKANIKSAYSKVDVDCRECGYRSRGTALGKLQAGQSPGCLCAKKTETKLKRWLDSVASNVTFQVAGCANPTTSRLLRFDFGLYNDTVLIELDGDIGHFGRGWGGLAKATEVPQRDLMKEQWAVQQGKVVIRLLQEDVYGDCWNWQGFLTSAIQHGIQNSMPCVLTQDAVQYRGGIYRKLRSNLQYQVGNFQLSPQICVPYLMYDLAQRPSKLQRTCMRRKLFCQDRKRPVWQPIL